MRKYLATLHQRPDHHKRRFALLTSGVVTLSIFIIWSLVRFGSMTSSNVADSQPNTAAVATSITPLQAIGSSIATAWASITSEFSSANSAIKSINTNGQ
jgi:hypothetical protein